MLPAIYIDVAANLYVLAETTTLENPWSYRFQPKRSNTKATPTPLLLENGLVPIEQRGRFVVHRGKRPGALDRVFFVLKRPFSFKIELTIIPA